MEIYAVYLLGILYTLCYSNKTLAYTLSMTLTLGIYPWLIHTPSDFYYDYNTAN